MNRFNKIMLLGLLSVVTGAASVKGAIQKFEAVQIGARFMAMPNPDVASREGAFANATSAGATKFISLDASNKSGSHEYINMDNATAETIATLLNKFNDTDVICVYPKFETTIANFDQINEVEKAKIATLYACWMIKNGCLYADNGKIQLNDQEIQLNEAQNTLVKSYFVKANESLLNEEPKVESKKAETKAQTSASGKAKKIAYATVSGLAAAYLSYLAIGNIVYNHADCSDESSSLTCAATSHANDVSVATYEFLTAAAAATGYSVTVLWNLLKQQFQLPTYSKPELPLVSLANKTLAAEQLANTTLPVEQIGYSCSDKMYEVLNPQDCSPLATIKTVVNKPGFFRGLLWPFLR